MTATSQRDGALEPDPGRPATSPQVRATPIGTHLLLVVSGEADLETSQALKEDLRAAIADRPNSVVVELSRLTSCDRAALQVITDFCAEAGVAGVPAVIHGASSPVGVGAGTIPAAERTTATPAPPVATGSPPTARPSSRDPVRAGRWPAPLPAPPRPWPIR